MTTEHSEARFFLRRNDVERDARFAPHPFNEFIAIVSAAAGFGCHRTRQRDIAAAQFIGTDLERGECTIHRRFAQPAILCKPFAQPDNPAEGIDNGKAITRWPRNQQPAVVRPQIDGGIGVFAIG